MFRFVCVLFIALMVFCTATSAGKLVCNRPNEEYRCGSACQTTCATLGQRCPIVNIRCNDACYCKEGYARYGGDTGMCVSISQCNSKRSAIAQILRSKQLSKNSGV
ncbi:inducible metalloproteinase inhibitor protein-like [Bombus affinis]|uniref:inducible metalloproteinase inhibitor protein-like n=1 Tax=Bombus affinis TaxID=309941 RepID=UPI0021B7A319|nr:inducible metalloproteinase inhibitor protein-like [Bombus affinis]